MPDRVYRNGYFDPTLVTELFKLVSGKSSIAKLVPSKPVPFNGNKEFTFSFDNEVEIVGEGGQKSPGGLTFKPVTIIPIKVVYQGRLSEEFIYASEEEQLDYLTAYSDGFAAKLARALDLMALHGVNPRTGLPSAIIGNNHLDYVTRNRTVIYGHGGAKADETLEEALAMIEAPNGIILGKTQRQAISGLRATGGDRLYPEFAWGGAPTAIGGSALDVNETVEAVNSLSRAYVGNFAAMKWGIAKEIPLEIIEYGDPDGLGDLKRTNEICIRSEAYIGWAFLNDNYFAKVARSGEAAGFSAEPESQTNTLLGKLVSELQSADLHIDGNNRVQGTLKYVTGYTGYSGEVAEQSGNYVALKFGSDDGATITVTSIGGSGRTVTLDEDKNIIIRMPDEDSEPLEAIKVIATTATETVEKVFDLTRLIRQKG